MSDDKGKDNIVLVLTAVVSPIFGALYGAFVGWVVGWAFSDPILGIAAQLGIHGFSMLQLGLFLGFVSGFFKKR